MKIARNSNNFVFVKQKVSLTPIIYSIRERKNVSIKLFGEINSLLIDFSYDSIQGNLIKKVLYYKGNTEVCFLLIMLSIWTYLYISCSQQPGIQDHSTDVVRKVKG